MRNQEKTDDFERSLALEIAAKTFTDPRSVLRELRALRGREPHVRGRSGERIRAELRARGLEASAKAA